MQTDHGYNPPPVWTSMGHFWSSLHPPTDGYLQFLASFDLLLTAAMFAAITWAFGWRVFPGVLIVGRLVVIAAHIWQQSRMASPAKLLLLGGAVATGAHVSPSIVV